MVLGNSIAVVKYLIASIFVGVILGIGGAFAAQGFRSGIIIISNYVENLFAREPNVFFYLITLSVALILVHYSKVLIKGKAFQSVSDSIYLAHKANNETDLKVGFISTLAAFFFGKRRCQYWSIWTSCSFRNNTWSLVKENNSF